MSLLSWERGLKSTTRCCHTSSYRSLLSWERGLKFPPPGRSSHPRVAPLVGAWIEIATGLDSISATLSLLSWERGLKYRCCCKCQGCCVAPLVGAWIEIIATTPILLPIASLLSWERGLKCLGLQVISCADESLLSWERGLKSCMPSRLSDRGLVAPLVGAWIEIVPVLLPSLRLRRSSRGSVD